MASKRAAARMVGLPPPQEQLISEFASESQGAPSPFGDDLPLPLPVEAIRYDHPGPEERPALLDSRGRHLDR